VLVLDAIAIRELHVFIYLSRMSWPRPKTFRIAAVEVRSVPL
jgi:hypothetical protein